MGGGWGLGGGRGMGGLLAPPAPAPVALAGVVTSLVVLAGTVSSIPEATAAPPLPDAVAVLPPDVVSRRRNPPTLPPLPLPLLCGSEGCVLSLPQKSPAG